MKTHLPRSLFWLVLLFSLVLGVAPAIAILPFQDTRPLDSTKISPLDYANPLETEQQL